MSALSSMASMACGIASGVTALLLLMLFIGICVWTYSGPRRRSFEATSRLPLEEDEPAPAPPPGKAP